MKLYHGSPKDLKILKPQKAKGINNFENIIGIFLTKTFDHAALYAIGKSLKGKTAFGVSENKLVILGNLKLKEGYVYEVEVENPIEGPNGQYASTEKLTPVKKTKVHLKDYEQYIVRVKNKEEIIKELEKDFKTKNIKFCPKCDSEDISLTKDNQIEGLKEWKCNKCDFEFTGAPEKIIYLDLATDEEVEEYSRIMNKLSKEEVKKIFNKCGWNYGEDEMYEKIAKNKKFAWNQIWNLLEDTPSNFNPEYHIKTHKLLKKAINEARR